MGLLIRRNTPHCKPTALLIPLLILLSLAACQIQTSTPTADVTPSPVLRSTVAVCFGPDGSLWRLTPTRDAVYVDYSEDDGRTFSSPVRVNATPQKISAWPENPPAIAVGRSGRINVLYYADEVQRSTSFFSYSDDGGKTFSLPKRISDHADSAMHYMDKMLINNADRLYLFWHDRRHEQLDQQQGSGVLSLYYSVSDGPEIGFENRFVSGGVCSCCRTATAFAPDDKPVLLARMVFADRVREHALMRLMESGDWSKPVLVTDDRWAIETCPEHGPALAIDDRHRSHFAWFTLGNIRQGIFYAHSDDYGRIVSEPMPLGNKECLPGHPDVSVLNDRVVLTWKEFDGKLTTIRIQESSDRGESWSEARTVLTSAADNGHPVLLDNGRALWRQSLPTA